MQYFQPTDVLLQSTQVFTSFILNNYDGTHPVFHFFIFLVEETRYDQNGLDYEIIPAGTTLHPLR